MASLDIITKYSEEPELYRFLARTKTCHEIRIGLSTYLVTGQKILLERIVCVQSRKIFFTPEQPLHPDLAQILDIFRYIGKVYILEIEADLGD